MNKKIVLLLGGMVTFLTAIEAATTPLITPENPAIAYTFNWPDAFNQPQYQMCVKPGLFRTVLYDFYTYNIAENVPDTEFGGWDWDADNQIEINRMHFYLTQAQCMGYSSGICLNSSLGLFRSNIVLTQNNPAYSSSNSLLISVNDIFFCYRSYLRQWYYTMYFLDQNNNDPTNQSINYGSNTASDIYGYLLDDKHDINGSYADLYPATNSLYSLQGYQWGHGLQGDYIINGNMGIFYYMNQFNGLLVNPDGSFNDAITDTNIIRTTSVPTSYSYTGYVEYYSNKTEQLNSYFNQNQTVFSNYLSQLYSSDSIGSTNKLLNILNDKTCPNMVVGQSAKSSLSPSVLPGLFPNELATSFFLNLFIPSATGNLSTVLPSDFSINQYLLPLNNALSFGSGFFLYFPLFMTDPGNPYYPQGWNYANANSVNYVESASNNSSNFDPENALMSNFYFQLSSTQSIAPLGLK